MKAATQGAHINLLPHRAMARKRREQACLRLLGGGALLGLLLALGTGAWMQFSLERMTQRQEGWRQAMQQSDKAIATGQAVQRETQALAARQAAIAQLQEERNAWVAMFAMLARVLPEGVVLHSLHQDGSRLRLQGQAVSQEKVSALLLALGKAAPHSAPELLEVRVPAHAKQGMGEGAVELTVQLKLAGP
ncbi:MULTISPECIES: PilN domain-containing protein [unclassified Janthinobacterium]|uniref:PilN domain-containing protein n=1 Tax=unclassified Janthinobacterium TaxID=2610881 RepID=UPI0016082FEF|nr:MULTISPECIES: PilN domain-containing protein [unclassified Janthinobacterium]MBB5370813.1 type IV pilus assembly protein PilN [Janthinobacterium sp. K2C7]MBB5383619.1 type IV pilus assembly protein PilN [Janthinobacterium sp. K2Li3]MBB5389073.1 type IV pilus assembly protein PilN [Janthinobacterium sp. K2E3]